MQRKAEKCARKSGEAKAGYAMETTIHLFFGHKFVEHSYKKQDKSYVTYFALKKFNNGHGGQYY